MPSFKNLEMAAAVSTHENIIVKKSFFSTKVIYAPTQSPVKVIVREYDPVEGARLQRLLDMPISKMEAELQRKGKPATAQLGNYRLEVCLSQDHRFCALQLIRFENYKNHALFEPRYYADNDVEAIVKLL